MFWRFSYTVSQIQTLLDKQDVTLKEIMDEDDVLQECKNSNEKLIEFLTQPENLKQLVLNIVTLPSEEISEKDRFKYSSISCELLTSDVAAINDALINNHELMDIIYSFLSSDDILNPLLASYFAKVMGILISKKTESFLSYIRSKEDFVSKFLKHINTSAIMDIFLRLLTTIDGLDLRIQVVEWLKSINLIDNLVNLFKYEYTNQIHSNVAQLLCDIIRISREQILSYKENNVELQNSKSSYDIEIKQDNENESNKELNLINLLKNSLLDQIESPQNIDKILDLTLESIDKQNCSLIYGIEVFLTILEPKTINCSEPSLDINFQNIDQDRIKREQEKLEVAAQGIKSMSSCCLKRLSTFHNLLLETKPKVETLSYSNGTSIPLFGSIRLNVVKLITKLIGLNDPDLNKEFIRLGTINLILELVFKYKWNNFLHSQLSEIVTNSFSIDYVNTMKNLKKTESTDEENKQTNEQENTEKMDTPQEQTDKMDDLEPVEKKTDEPLNNIIENPTEILVKSEMIEHLIRDCNIIKRLVDVWNGYFEELKEKKNARINPAGYVGHLTVISNLIINHSKDGRFSSVVQKCFNEFPDQELLSKWKELYDIQIQEINKINSKELVKNPYLYPRNNGEQNSENENSDANSDEHLNKKFLDLHKEMKINCVEDFSLSESQIVNFNPKFGNSFNKSKAISFQIEANDESAQVFEQVCLQRNNMSLTSGAGAPTSLLEEEVWISQDIKFAENFSNVSSSPSTSDKKNDNWMGFSSENQFKLDFNEETKSSNNSKRSANEKLALTNYSSSSSSSESSSTSSDDDEEGNPKKSDRNKRHHHHQKHPHKELKQRGENMDISPTSSKLEDPIDFEKVFDNNKINSNPNNENWADFGSFIPNQNKEATSEQNLVGSLNKNLLETNDPWNSEPTTTTPNVEDKNWANFDNFS